MSELNKLLAQRRKVERFQAAGLDDQAKRAKKRLNELERVSEFDPADHNVADVLAFIEKHPDQATSVLAAEKEGKNRSTIVNQEASDGDNA